MSTTDTTSAPQHRMIDTGRLRMHVTEAGEGPPVVLLHGWPQHSYAWRHVIPLLARSHRVIAVDSLGAPLGPMRRRRATARVISSMTSARCSTRSTCRWSTSSATTGVARSRSGSRWTTRCGCAGLSHSTRCTLRRPASYGAARVALPVDAVRRDAVCREVGALAPTSGDAKSSAGATGQAALGRALTNYRRSAGPDNDAERRADRNWMDWQTGSAWD